MTIDELIAALEKAEGPSRELDRDIHESAGQCAHRESKYWCIEDGNDFDSGFDCVKCGSSEAWEIEVPKYTASLDAALTLVPEGCDFGFEVEHVFGGPCVYARCQPGSWIAPVDDPRELVTIQRDTQAAAARMIPVAICIAALKARRFP